MKRLQLLALLMLVSNGYITKASGKFDADENEIGEESSSNYLKDEIANLATEIAYRNYIAIKTNTMDSLTFPHTITKALKDRITKEIHTHKNAIKSINQDQFIDWVKAIIVGNPNPFNHDNLQLRNKEKELRTNIQNLYKNRLSLTPDNSITEPDISHQYKEALIFKRLIIDQITPPNAEHIALSKLDIFHLYLNAVQDASETSWLAKNAQDLDPAKFNAWKNTVAEVLYFRTMCPDRISIFDKLYSSLPIDFTMIDSELINDLKLDEKLTSNIQDVYKNRLSLASYTHTTLQDETYKKEALNFKKLILDQIIPDTEKIALSNKTTMKIYEQAQGHSNPSTNWLAPKEPYFNTTKFNTWTNETARYINHVKQIKNQSAMVSKSSKNIN